MKKYISLLLLLFLTATAAKTIPPVLITAPKNYSHTLTSGSQTTITHKQLIDSGSTSLAHALQSLGGVQLQDSSGNGSQVSLGMRGFGANASSNTLLLINGIPITNPDMAPPDLNVIPIHQIEAIEIIAGSESVAYGDQAVGGVINLITKEKKGYVFSCAGGSYNQKNCYLSSHENTKGIDINFNIAANHNSNYREHNNYDQQIISGNFIFPYQSTNIKLNYLLANEYMQYPGALTNQQVRQNRRQANNGVDYFKNINGNIHLQIKHDLTSNWQVNTDLSHRQMQGSGVLFSSFTQSRSVNFFKPQINGKISSISTTSGIDLQNDSYQLNSAFGATNNVEQQYGLYSIANKDITQKIAISIGARGAMQDSTLHTSTSNETINRALATTMGATYKLANNIDIYLRRAGNFRFPKADENASTSSSITTLRTQRGTSYETGIQTSTDNYSGNFSLYQLNLRDEIAFDPTQTPQQPFGSNRNLSPTTRRGFSLSGKSTLPNFKRLSVDAQYNCVNAHFQNGINSGNIIPLVSENIFHAGINYEFTNNWNIYAESLFTGRQYAANDDANIAGVIGGYTIYNFNLAYQIKSIRVDMRVNNIFNKDYYFYTVYQSSVPNEYFYPAADRNFIITARYSFD